MGKVYSQFAWRISRNLNVENRALRAIERRTPVTSPRPAATQREVQLQQREQPELREHVQRRDDHLLSRLRDVYVTSSDRHDNEQKVEQGSEGGDLVDEGVSAHSKLPVDRVLHQPSEFGYHEPQEVPYGRLTLRQAVQLLEQHRDMRSQQQDDQRRHTQQIVHELAVKFKIDEQLCADMVNNFLVMTVGTREQVLKLTGASVQDEDEEEDEGFAFASKKHRSHQDKG